MAKQYALPDNPLILNDNNKMEMEYSLERFIKTQDSYNIHEIALQEMKAGHKRSHWIWYVFPQLKGFGHSYNSEYYGLDNIEEAKAYFKHPILGNRLREITSVLLDHTDEDMVLLMGSHIDAIKLRSCMTLFDTISPQDVFSQVLETFFDGKRDKRTLAKIM